MHKQLTQNSGRVSEVSGVRGHYLYSTVCTYKDNFLVRVHVGPDCVGVPGSL